VRPLDFPLLTDENIAADVVAGLRARGCDVRSADEERLIGRGDDEVLERATALHRVIVTHDLAFGKADIQNTYVQLIYTTDLRAYRRGRMCLIGDAGIVAQPFTVSGVFKGYQSVKGLIGALERASDVEAALET
jgi:2-polyprenyl-6-methoxyphenol hydroxylase-like FAD-dependent oxidoreductase